MNILNEKTLEHLKILCYEVVLGEMIDAKTRDKAQKVVERYLFDGGYKINYVKCDEENNPPSVVDSNKMIVTISEQTNYSNQHKIYHLEL